MKKIPETEKATMLVNFKFHRNVVKVLDRLVESGLYKTRVDIVLSALRIYKPFREMWKKEVLDATESQARARGERKICRESAMSST